MWYVLFAIFMNPWRGYTMILLLKYTWEGALKLVIGVHSVVFLDDKNISRRNCFTWSIHVNSIVFYVFHLVTIVCVAESFALVQCFMSIYLILCSLRRCCWPDSIVGCSPGARVAVAASLLHPWWPFVFNRVIGTVPFFVLGGFMPCMVWCVIAFASRLYKKITFSWGNKCCHISKSIYEVLWTSTVYSYVVFIPVKRLNMPVLLHH